MTGQEFKSKDNRTNRRHLNDKCNAMQKRTNAICKNTRYIHAHFYTERNAIRLQFGRFSVLGLLFQKPIRYWILSTSSAHIIEFCLHLFFSFIYLFIYLVEVVFDLMLFSKECIRAPVCYCSFSILKLLFRNNSHCADGFWRGDVLLRRLSISTTATTTAVIIVLLLWRFFNGSFTNQILKANASLFW